MLKATGIVRKVDELGRIVIPKELCDTMGIKEKDPMEIFTDGEQIILGKYAPGCVFCSSVDQVSYFKDKVVCNQCLNDMPAPAGVAID